MKELCLEGIAVLCQFCPEVPYYPCTKCLSRAPRKILNTAEPPLAATLLFVPTDKKIHTLTLV